MYSDSFPYWPGGTQKPLLPLSPFSRYSFPIVRVFFFKRPKSKVIVRRPPPDICCPFFCLFFFLGFFPAPRFFFSLGGWWFRFTKLMGGFPLFFKLFTLPAPFSTGLICQEVFPDAGVYPPPPHLLKPFGGQPAPGLCRFWTESWLRTPVKPPHPPFKLDSPKTSGIGSRLFSDLHSPLATHLQPLFIQVLEEEGRIDSRFPHSLAAPEKLFGIVYFSWIYFLQIIWLMSFFFRIGGGFFRRMDLSWIYRTLSRGWRSFFSFGVVFCIRSFFFPFAQESSSWVFGKRKSSMRELRRFPSFAFLASFFFPVALSPLPS